MITLNCSFVKTYSLETGFYVVIVSPVVSIFFSLLMLSILQYLLQEIGKHRDKWGYYFGMDRS